QAARLGDVGESQRACAISPNFQVVPEQSSFRGPPVFWWEECLSESLSCTEHSTLREKDIKIAVIVVIEQRHSGAHVLGVVKTTGHSVEVHEIQPRLSSRIDEPVDRRTWRGRCARTAWRGSVT